MVQALGVNSCPEIRPMNIWRNSFDTPEQLSADAIALIRQVLRLQRQ